MVSISVPPDVPGLDIATKDIAGALRGMRDVSCGFGSLPIYLVAIAKADNTVLPLYMPVPYADVEGRVLGALFVPVKTVSARTDSNGIAYACVPILPTVWYDFRVKKSDVDFGNGVGEWSDRRRLRDIVVFKGTKKMPCPSARIPVAVSNFNRLDYKPNISTLPFSVNYEGFGTVPVGGSFRLYVGGVQVGSGRAEPGSRIDHTMPSALKDLGSIKDLLGKSVTVRVEIDHGICTFAGETKVSLPALAVPCYGELGLNLDSVKDILSRFAKLPTSLNVPVFITNATGDIGSTKINIFVGGVPAGSTYAGGSIDLIRVLKDRVSDLEKVNQITLVPESPCIERRTFDIPSLKPTGIVIELPCTVWETQAKVTMPQILQYPFSTYISGAKWLCKDTGKPFPIDGVDAEVYIGAMRFTIPIRSGAGSLALKLEDIKDIIAARAETIAPEIEAPARVTAECDKRGDVEGAAELQAWLSICYAGKRYRVEGLGPLFKIVRENGSHFWGKRYQDIRDVLRSNP